MSDTELTDIEAARLRQLLHRAADSLEVTTPDVDSIDLQRPADRSARGRWLFAAAAVLIVVLAATGAVWLLSGEDEDRIDTGPAEPPVTVAPQVLEQTGVWRLPEGLDGYRVIGAQDGGSFDSSEVNTPGVLAVDDVANPSRWLLVQAYDELGELPPDARQVPVSDEVTAALVPTSGSTWFRLTPTGDISGAPVVGGSALGIDEAELTALLGDRFSTVDALAAAADSTDTMESTLDDAGFGNDRLVWQGNGDGGPGSSNQQVQVSLAGDDGSEVTIIMNQSDSLAWSVAVRLRLTSELLFMRSTGTTLGTVSVLPRPDLGRNVLQSVADVPGQASTNYLVVISDDGAWTSVLPAFASSPTAGSDPSDSLSEEQQLRIINGLRAMSEDEFRARLTELGAEFVGAESVGVTTTVVSGPGG